MAIFAIFTGLLIKCGKDFANSRSENLAASGKYTGVDASGRRQGVDFLLANRRSVIKKTPQDAKAVSTDNTLKIGQFGRLDKQALESDRLDMCLTLA